MMIKYIVKHKKTMNKICISYLDDRFSSCMVVALNLKIGGDKPAILNKD